MSTDIKSAHARRAAAIRHGNTKAADAARAEIMYAKIDRAIDEAMKVAPALTDSQRLTLIQALSGGAR